MTSKRGRAAVRPGVRDPGGYLHEHPGSKLGPFSCARHGRAGNLALGRRSAKPSRPNGSRRKHSEIAIRQESRCSITSSAPTVRHEAPTLGYLNSMDFERPPKAAYPHV